MFMAKVLLKNTQTGEEVEDEFYPEKVGEKKLSEEVQWQFL